ncbi:hypothetical protein F4823DRAFT_158203 [Ustulina deusta]|nr:hypothetical protein F4823DRAFT_158203 [Ustulina deusta]
MATCKPSQPMKRASTPLTRPTSPSALRVRHRRRSRLAGSVARPVAPFLCLFPSPPAIGVHMARSRARGSWLTRRQENRESDEQHGVAEGKVKVDRKLKPPYPGLATGQCASALVSRTPCCRHSMPFRISIFSLVPLLVAARHSRPSIVPAPRQWSFRVVGSSRPCTKID